MLLVAGVVLIGSGKNNGAVILEFIGPLIILTVLEAIDHNSTCGIREVEAHILPAVAFSGVETGDFSGKFVIGGGIGLLDEFRNGYVRNLRLALTCLEALDSCVHYLVLLFVGIVLVSTVEDYGAAVRELGGPFLILAALEAINEDGSGIIGDVELHIVPAAVIGAGLEGTYLAGEPVISVGLGLLNEIRDSAGSNFLLGFCLFHHAVKGVDVCALAGVLLHCLCGFLVFCKVAEDDDLITNLDIGILALDKLTVAKVIDLVCLKVLFIVGVILLCVGHIERGVTVGVACKVLFHLLVSADLVDKALYVEGFVAGGVVCGDVFHYPGVSLTGAECSLRGFAVTVCNSAFLAHSDAGCEKAGHKVDAGAASFTAAKGVYGNLDGGNALLALGGNNVEPILGGRGDKGLPGL